MRNYILDFIKREIIGPDPVKPHVQENGEEILFPIPPRQRYGAGILFPKSLSFSRSDSLSEDEQQAVNSGIKESDVKEDDPVNSEEKNTPIDVAEDYEEEIGLANSFLPSAMGLSCFSRIPESGFLINIKAAIYKSGDHTYQKGDKKTTTVKAYYRIPLDQKLTINSKDIPVDSGKSRDFVLVDSEEKVISLKLNIRNRTHGDYKNEDIHLLSFTLINQNTKFAENIRNEDCFFQVSFSVSAINEEKCFCPYKIVTSKADKEDEKSNQLLFRNKKTFAVGHGCSPHWNDEDIENTNSIKTEAIP